MEKVFILRATFPVSVSECPYCIFYKGYSLRGRMTSSTPCIFYLQGRCQKGTSCMFRHPNSSSSSSSMAPRDEVSLNFQGSQIDGDEVEICRYSLRGRCSRGETCLYRHHNTSSSSSLRTREQGDKKRKAASILAKYSFKNSVVIDTTDRAED